MSKRKKPEDRNQKSDVRCQMSERKQHSYILVFTFYFLIFNSFSFSQTVSSSLNRNKILLGEQVSLQLKADIKESDFSLVNWFIFPDTINHFEVINRSKIDTIENNGSISYLQTITLTSFDSGLWNLPKLQIILQNKTGKQILYTTDTNAALQVIPVDVSNMKDYHDIKTIIDVQPDNSSWMYIAVIVAAIAFCVIILWLIFRKRKKKNVPVKKSIIKGSPLDWAMEQLDILQKENYPAKDQAKIFYTKLDEIYRTYFDEKINIGSLQMTTDEMMVRLKIYFSKEEIRTKFYQTMRLAKVVKFAKYLPASIQNNEALNITREAIKYIDNQVSQMKTENAY